MASTKENNTTIKPQKESQKKSPKKEKILKSRPLTIKEKAFCREYVKSGNATQSVYKAGYKYKNDRTAGNAGCMLLKKPGIQEEITRLLGAQEKKAIMDAQEVMELFSAIARGEVKDQFGLDATLNDRLKAMNEIAKRTIDIDNRIKGIPDNTVSIKVDWKRS